jgi:hypothetical protein
MSVVLHTSARTQQHLEDPSEWPMKDPAFLELRSYDKSKNIKIYKLNVSMLSKSEFHMFWGLKACETRLIVRALEFFTFHPLTPLNKKFNITPMICNNFVFFWCSFPQEFKDVVIKAAKTFNFQINRTTKVMVGREGRSSDVPALTLAEDYKERSLFCDKDYEPQKPISKDALCIPVKKESFRIFIEFPQARNILWFKAQKSMSEDEIDNREEASAAIGDDLHKLGVD